MDRRYTILAILLIVAAFGLLIIPDRSNPKEISPVELLISVDDPARFLSTDLITERIIGADPTLQLIDVRNPVQFRQFALKGAVNIPLDSLCSPKWKEVLNQPGKDVVFYSNADIEADQAWQICKRSAMNHIFVMKGGLNYWLNTIMKSTPPPATAPSENFDLYNFRLAARQFFTVGSLQGINAINKETGQEKNASEKIKVIKKEPGAASGGGC